MIARLRGTVLSLQPPLAVIDVAGVGFRVSCSQAALDTLDLGGMADLHTYLVVREDDLSLYAFASEDEVTLFRMLLGVSGIGARTALAMLSKLQPDVLRVAIANGNSDTLSRVPGIGRKTAEKIIFALKDKLGGLEAIPAMPFSSVDSEVISALTTLGYSNAEARAALVSLPHEESRHLDFEEKLRRALAYFS